MAERQITAQADWHIVRLLNCSVPPSQPSSDFAHTGLAHATNDGVEIHTGVASGPITINLRALDQRPEPSDPVWEDVAEISVDVEDGPLVPCGPMESPNPAALRLDGYGPGSYRLRIHGANRDEFYDLASLETSEEYLIESWPEQSAAPEIIASSSTASRSWIGSAQRPTPPGRAGRAKAIEADSVLTRVEVPGGDFVAEN